MTDELAGVHLQLPRHPTTNYVTISNSEVVTFAACEKKHYFGFGLGLTSRNHEEQLQHGIIGHKVLEVYYRNRRDGLTHKEAVMLALDVYHEAKGIPQLVLMQSMKRFLEYFSYYENDEWEIVLVEDKLEVQLENSIYGFTVDLLVRNAAGKYILFDHKVVPKFWGDNKPKYEPQLYKYIWALRKLGYPVDRAFYNFIKYSDSVNGEQLRRVSLALNEKKIQSIMAEHIRIADRILERRQLPVAAWNGVVVRNLGFACDYCMFKLPCEMELEGRDISRTLATDFVPNDYGYHHE